MRCENDVKLVKWNPTLTVDCHCQGQDRDVNGDAWFLVEPVQTSGQQVSVNR
jgi:hypothetical protein